MKPETKTNETINETTEIVADETVIDEVSVISIEDFIESSKPAEVAGAEAKLQNLVVSEVIVMPTQAVKIGSTITKQLRLVKTTRPSTHDFTEEDRKASFNSARVELVGNHPEKGTINMMHLDVRVNAKGGFDFEIARSGGKSEGSADWLGIPELVKVVKSDKGYMNGYPTQIGQKVIDMLVRTSFFGINGLTDAGKDLVSFLAAEIQEAAERKASSSSSAGVGQGQVVNLANTPASESPFVMNED